MKKQELEELLNLGLPLRKMSEKSNKSITSLRYWIKKFGLKPNFNNFNTKEYGETRFCPKCKKNCPIQDFYKRRGKLFSSTYCKNCTNSKTVERMIKFKSLCVEYKGGKCIICGYNKYYGSLEFHHIDPSQKDFTISHMKKYSFDDIVKYELDKCALLCANCHREVENGIVILVAPLRIERKLSG